MAITAIGNKIPSPSSRKMERDGSFKSPSSVWEEIQEMISYATK